MNEAVSIANTPLDAGANLFKVYQCIARGIHGIPEISKETGVSREAVRKSIADLANTSSIHQTSDQISCVTPKELFINERKNRWPGLTTRFDMSPKVAYLFMNATDFYSRILIGQFEEIDQEIRMDAWGFGQSLNSDHSELVASALREIKSTLMHFQSNASHGIASHKIPLDANCIFGMKKSLAHRVCWDNTPRGGIGVDFDEPLFDRGVNGNVLSYSYLDRRNERHFVLEVTAEYEKFVLESLNAYARIGREEYEVIIELAKSGHLRNRDGAVPSSEEIAAAEKIIAELKSKCASVNASGISQKAQLLNAIPEMIESMHSTGRDEVWSDESAMTLTVSNASSSKAKIQIALEQLPENFALINDYKNFSVIKFDGDLKPLMISTSHSPQTAIVMAKNRIEGYQGRSFDF